MCLENARGNTNEQACLCWVIRWCCYKALCAAQRRKKRKKKLNTEFLVLEWLGISTPSTLLDYEDGSLALKGVQGKELFW